MAWLALDPYDDDFTVFARYFVAALQTVGPACGRATLGLWQLPQLPPGDYIAATLLEELAALPEPCILVLDDYHAIRNPTVHALLSGLVARLPPTVHLALATRADPPLPLARWRAHGQLNELGAADLQFSAAEVGAYLGQALGTPPPLDAVEALHARTEGWIAGVQLASLSLKASTDPAASLLAFQQSAHRHVRDFLLDDVLAQQPANVQAFLLRTAVLDRFCARLCDALRDEPPQAPSSQELLEHIERENLFVVGLDQQWYRYHPLFKEALLHRLGTQSDPREIAALHRRASNWLAAAGLIEEAVHQALAAGDARQAARVVETQAVSAINHEKWMRLEHWLGLLPPEIIPTRPTLLVMQGVVQRIREQFVAMEASCEAAETLLANAASQEGLSAAVLQGHIDALRSDYYYHKGDAERSVAHARRALESLPTEHHYFRGLAMLFSGVARYWLGDGQTTVAELRAEWQRGTPADAVYTGRVLIGLLTIYAAAGDLLRMEEAARALLQLSSAHEFPLSASWAYYALGYVSFQRNDLDTAEAHFTATIALPVEGHFVAARDSLLALSLIYEAQGRTALARSTAEQASERMQDTGNEPQLMMTRAVEARLACQRSDVAAAAQWLRAWQENAPYIVSWRIEIPHITRARVLIAQNTPESLQRATRELATLVDQCEALHDVPHLIEVLALQAVAYHLQGATAEALGALARAVQLAGPGGFLRPFLEPGSCMAELVRQLVARGPVSAHARRILEALPSAVGPAATVPDRPGHPELAAESLTWREAEVLGLLAARLSNKEIAHRLSVSTETIKQHATNIYQKLQVSGRREAVLRARSLGLLAPTEPEATVLVPVASPQRTSALTEPAAAEDRASV
ncbi:MAG TPA: LuxR C-terminal-related transcriptional regulator [Chloroflexota bacterium]